MLRPNGVLFHYIGDPDSSASGRLFRGVGTRLREAGFAPSVAREAYGIRAVKVDGSRTS